MLRMLKEKATDVEDNWLQAYWTGQLETVTIYST